MFNRGELRFLFYKCIFIDIYIYTKKKGENNLPSIILSTHTKCPFAVFVEWITMNMAFFCKIILTDNAGIGRLVEYDFRLLPLEQICYSYSFEKI